MKKTITVNDLDSVKEKLTAAVSNILHNNIVSYADIRLEASEGVGAYSEDGHPKVTSLDWGLSLGIRVIAGKHIQASGFYGRQLGITDYLDLENILRDGFQTAYLRAKANSIEKRLFKKQAGSFGKTLSSTRLAPIDVRQEVVKPDFDIDPRSVRPKEMTDFACQAAARAKVFHPHVRRVEVVVNTGISRQLFVSSEGTVIDQWTCSSGGTIFILAQNDDGGKPADLYHHTGNQLGFEALTEGKNAHEQSFDIFAEQIANETVQLANAKPAPTQDKPVTIVLDPDLVALFAHEIIGHPSELDRALKMEAGYAGRSWFFDNLKKTMQGKKIGSSLLTAFSDPTLRGGYGYYLYDDEGTPAKRVYHIKNGMYKQFMNSRQTAEIVGAQPNGHYKANDASAVPLIRMSVSAIAPGKQDPQKIISEVEYGYYCVGHRIPSISESRENFQIAPRLIYEIRNGEIGEVYRDGRVTADSKDFFMSIDAVGHDFKVFPIPNCGKGQPMQAKQVGNGGPTLRAKAKIARGEYS